MWMSLSKLSRGTLIILGSAALLFIFSLFNWSKACAASICATGETAWGRGVGPLYGILLILTLAVVVLVVLVDADVVKMKLPELPIKYFQLICGLGALTVIFGFIRWLQKPSGGGVVDVSWTISAWISLILIIVLAVGVVLRYMEGDSGSTAASPTGS
jgi:hypothetical protein